MKRKRWMWMAAAVLALAWMAGSLGDAQNGQPPPQATNMTQCVPNAEPACCKDGVPTVKPGEKCVRIHKVGPGENLHVLAAYYYGDARMWTKIYQDNRRVIGNPNRLQVGMVLKVEVPPCWVPKFDLQCFLQIEARRQVVHRPAQAAGRRVIKKEVVQPAAETVTLPEEEGKEKPPAKGGGEKKTEGE